MKTSGPLRFHSDFMICFFVYDIVSTSCFFFQGAKSPTRSRVHNVNSLATHASKPFRKPILFPALLHFVLTTFVSVFPLTKTLQLILEISTTYLRLVSYLLAD